VIAASYEKAATLVQNEALVRAAPRLLPVRAQTRRDDLDEATRSAAEPPTDAAGEVQAS
jgi:hypothetical protein